MTIEEKLDILENEREVLKGYLHDYEEGIITLEHYIEMFKLITSNTESWLLK